MHKTNDDTSTGSHHAWGSSCGSLPLILVYQHVPDNSQIREWKKSTKTHCIKGTAYSSSSESDLYWLWLSSGDLCSFVSMSELPSKVWNDSRSVTKYPSSIGLQSFPLHITICSLSNVTNTQGTKSCIYSVRNAVKTLGLLFTESSVE